MIPGQKELRAKAVDFALASMASDDTLEKEEGAHRHTWAGLKARHWRAESSLPLMLPGLAGNVAQAVRVVAGSICLVQKQWCLVSPVRLLLGRITATYHSDERHPGEKLGHTNPCSQNTSLRLRTIKGRSCATAFG